MKNNKIMKLCLILMTSFVLIVLVKQNVTAKKEDPKEPQESSSIMNLEINSELVNNAYNSLILLNDRIIDDEFYRHSYFNINEEKDNLSNEEKLYSAFESLYRKDKFIKETEDDIEILKINTDQVKEEILNLFKDESFDTLNVNYKPSINCGIVDYLYTGNTYELKFKKCTDKKVIDRSKLENAVKDGNYIKLTLKSFYATQTEKDNYTIKNYGDDREIQSVTLKDIDEHLDEIINNNQINKYTFSFELKGDKYYLVKIEKNK